MYCVIDIGSNTIRLVIFRQDAGILTPVLSSKTTAGLAGYVDKKNCLSREGIRRLISVLRKYRDVTAMLPDCPLYPFATASLRNIVNTDQVLETVWRETGLGIQVLSGYEEAMLDYRGAIRRASLQSGILADVGGGSTELVVFRDRTVLAAHSLPVGSLNLYSACVGDLIPKKKELREMREKVCAMMRSALPPVDGCLGQPLCGVGGTARAALALYQNLNKAGGAAPVFYPRSFLDDVLAMAVGEPRKLMRRILKVAPERVHTLVPGVLILQCAAELYQSERICTSPCGVREGYLSFMLEKEGISCD